MTEEINYIKNHKLYYYIQEQHDLKKNNLENWEGNLNSDQYCRLKTQVDTLKHLLDEYKRGFK